MAQKNSINGKGKEKVLFCSQNFKTTLCICTYVLGKSSHEDDSKINTNEIVIYEDQRLPKSLRAYTKNGLAYFLIANLLTGCVNMTIRTIDYSNCPAVLILLAYCYVLHSIFMWCFDHKVCLKFW